MKILGVIPAREGSKRLPGKNIRPLLGVPLIGWSGRFAAASSIFSRAVLSTDSIDIAKVGQSEGMDVPFLRPAELASDTSSSVEVVLHALDTVEAKTGPYDAVALLQPTCPFRQEHSWKQAYLKLASGAPAAVGVAPTETPPYHNFVMKNENITPLFEKELTMRSQDLPTTVHLTGGLYLIRTEVLRSFKGFFPDGTAPILCDHKLDKVDIDTHTDFVEAEWLAKRYEILPPAEIL